MPHDGVHILALTAERSSTCLSEEHVIMYICHLRTAVQRTDCRRAKCSRTLGTGVCIDLYIVEFTSMPRYGSF